MDSEIRVAVIGAGYWGLNLVRVFQRTDGVWLACVCDSRPDALQEVKRQHPHVALSVSQERILQDKQVDAIVVATPPATHYSLTRAALSAGKHVWVEKPLALRYAHGRELVALAHEVQRTLFVDETFLYDPLVQQARALIAAGALGTIHHLSLERTGMGRIRRDSNVWWNFAPHDLSILRYVLDAQVSRLSVTGHAFLQPGIEDVAWASLQLDNKVSAHVYLHWLFPTKKASLTVVGESGVLAYEGRFGNRRLTRYEYRLGSLTPTSSQETTQANLVSIDHYEAAEVRRGDRIEPLALACAAFRDSIVRGVPAPSRGESSLQTLAVLDAGARSLMHHGQWLSLGNLRPGRERPPQSSQAEKE